MTLLSNSWSRRWRVAAVVLAWSVAVGGCGDDSPSGPDPDPGPLTLRVLDRDTLSFPGNDTALVSPVPGGLEVLGRITTPTPCYDLKPGTVREPPTALTLLIIARERDVDACIQVLHAFPYQLRVRDLDPGEYDVEVIHTYPDTGWAERLAARVRVVVP